ncbi:MAG: hypothetical protein STSR0009_05230 [Methanoregula sp.]
MTSNVNDLVSLLFLFITALATSTYAWLFWKSLEPLISIGIEFDKNDNLTMMLVIENAGNGPAYDVKFEIIPDFEFTEGRFLSQIGLIKNGLPFFSPHKKIMTYLTWMPNDYKRKISNPFTIQVSYKRHKWSYYKCTKEFVIDLALFGEVPPPPNPLSQISENLKNLQNIMDNLGSSKFKKFKVVAYTKEENDREIEQEILIMKKMETENKS